jgi:Zn finger protein HypA/HybF involved in hydrogenase expression
MAEDGGPKIVVVCAHCRHHNSSPALEMNFRDARVYYICPECDKESVMILKPAMKPLAKPRVGVR